MSPRNHCWWSYRGQINDTDLHSPLKVKYRDVEHNLVLEQLRVDSKKITQPSRNDIIRMLAESFNSLKMDLVNRFKTIWVVNSSDDCFSSEDRDSDSEGCDSSEDYLVSERVIPLVGSHWKKFQNELMKKRALKVSNHYCT